MEKRFNIYKIILGANQVSIGSHLHHFCPSSLHNHPALSGTGPSVYIPHPDNDIGLHLGTEDRLHQLPNIVD